MKSKSFRRILSLITVFALLATALMTGATATADADSVVARYLVTSDVHNNNTGLAKAIQSTYDYAQTQDYKGFDAIVVAGDLTNYGKDEEFTAFADSLEAKLSELYPDSEAPVLIAAMGNHDYGNKTNTDEVNAAYRASFENIVGCAPSAVYDVNGHSFIAMSGGRHVGDFDYDWLAEQLATADAANPDEPINVIIHFPITNTVYGSSSGSYYNNSRMTALLAQYPNVIFWTGHTHAYLGNERSLYQDEFGFTAINTGAMATTDADYPDDVNGTVSAGIINAHYIVEILADGDTRIRRYDNDTDEFFANDWYVGDDYDNTYSARQAATQAPAFDNGSALTLGGGVNGSLVSFNDVDNVELYVVTATDGNNTVESTYMRHYYHTTVPTTFTAAIDGLEPDTTYDISVKAVDFFGNESQPLTTTLTTGHFVDDFDTLHGGAVSADDWTGDTDWISDQYGFYNNSNGNSRVISLASAIDLGDRFEVATDFWRNEFNMYDTNYSFIQIGELGIAMRRTPLSNTIALCYGYSVGASASPIDGANVIAQIDAPNTTKLEEYRILFDNGNITVYRSGAAVLSVTAAEFNQAVERITGKSGYDFSNASVKLKLFEQWLAENNGAYFKTFSLKANIPQNASYNYFDSPFNTTDWTVIGTQATIDELNRFEIKSSGNSNAVKSNELIDFGDAFIANVYHQRNKYNCDAVEFSYAQFGDVGLLIKNNFAESTGYLSLCYGFDATANGKTAPTAEQILATSVNLGSPSVEHKYSLKYSDGMITVLRDDSFVLSYDATALNLDFSQAQVAFQMYETYVTENEPTYFADFSIEREFTVSELDTMLGQLCEGDKVVATKAEVVLAKTMYDALADYQRPLLTNTANLELAVSTRLNLKGDIDKDGLLAPVDYQMLTQSVLGLGETLSDPAADIDNNDTVDSADVLALMQMLLGI